MAGIHRSVQRFCQACGCRGFLDAIGFTNESDAHGKPLDGLKATFQDWRWSMVAPHAVDSDPDSVLIIDLDVFAGNAALEATERIHHRLQHGSGHGGDRPGHGAGSTG